MQSLSQALTQSPLAAAATLFVAGVGSSFLPCIYPMIPITAGVLAGNRRAGASKARVAGLTLTYVLGLALFYAILGLIAGMTGSLFGTIAANPYVMLVVGNILLLSGLMMLEAIPVAVPQRLMAWAGSLSGGSYPSVFLMGAMSGIVAAPCGAPAFLAVLTWVAATKSAALGFLYLFVFSLGMSAILVAVGLFSGTLAALPRAGGWMLWIKRIAGVLLIGVAEYYFIRTGQGL